MLYFSRSKAINIANKFKTQTYQWKPARRTIPKPGKRTLRPIDTPTQQDRIVQEAIRCILECIFEPEFTHFEIENNAKWTHYGFRPNKSTWDAVKSLKTKGQSTNYAFEGDISGAYNNVNHTILLQLLSKRIKDRKFLHTISQLLKSGVMEQNKSLHSLKSTAQGGIVSPLLFNIYMFEFDKFIYDKYIKKIALINQTKKKIPSLTLKL